MSNRTFVVQYIIKASDAYSRHADQVSSATKRMTDNFIRAKKSIKSFYEATKKAGKNMSLWITTPVLAAAWALKNAARDAEETESKFATVFSSMSEQSETAARNLAKNYGLSRTEAKRLMGDTGDLLTGFGFSQQAALDMSTSVNQLAVDLASFTNYSGGASGASAALTKALLGERESLKSLGIAISEEQVKAKIAQMMAQGMTFQSLQQAKARATLAIAMEQSKNAIGDFARTSQGLANQERITASRIQDMKESFGKVLLPVMLKITQAVGRFAEWLTNLSPAAKKTVIVIAAILAVIGPLLLAISFFGMMIPGLIAGLGALGVAFTVMTGPIGLAVMAIVALAGILIANWDTVKGWFVWFGEFIGGLFTKIKNMFLGFIQGYIDVFRKVASFVGIDLPEINIVKTEKKVTDANVTQRQAVAVDVNVGLDKGLQQTGETAVTGVGGRRPDVGAAA